MEKNTLAKIILALGLPLLFNGCSENKSVDAVTKADAGQKISIKDLEKGPEMVDYFGTILPEHYNWMHSIALISGDFNEDGHLDVITSNSENGELQYYEGDGKGNFKLRQYPLKK